MNYINNFKVSNRRKNKIIEQVNAFYKTKRNRIKTRRKTIFINRRYNIADEFNVTFKRNLIILYDLKNRYSFMIRLINKFKFFLLQFFKIKTKRASWFNLNLTPFFSFFFFKLDLFNNSKKKLKPNSNYQLYIDNIFDFSRKAKHNSYFNTNVTNYFSTICKNNNNYIFNIKLLKKKKNYIKNFYYKNYKKFDNLEENYDTMLVNNLNFLRLYNLFILFILYFIKLFSIYFIKLYFNLWFSFIYMFQQIPTKIYILYKFLIDKHLIKLLHYRKLPLFNFLFRNKDEKFFRRDLFTIFSINIKRNSKKFFKRERNFLLLRKVSSRGLILYV